MKLSHPCYRPVSIIIKYLPMDHSVYFAILGFTNRFVSASTFAQISTASFDLFVNDLVQRFLVLDLNQLMGRPMAEVNGCWPNY